MSLSPLEVSALQSMFTRTIQRRFEFIQRSGQAILDASWDELPEVVSASRKTDNELREIIDSISLIIGYLRDPEIDKWLLAPETWRPEGWRCL